MEIEQVVEALGNRTIIFAESCTAGLVSATLARVPGISKNLMGSLVVYQPWMKTELLGVPPELIAQHTPESMEVAIALAKGLTRFNADLCVSIVGHLEEREVDDGKLWSCIIQPGSGILCNQFAIKLKSKGRVNRMQEAAEEVLHNLFLVLSP